MFPWYDQHPTTKRLIEFATNRLGVQVHSIDSTTARRWADARQRPTGRSSWPLGGPVANRGYCSMGSSAAGVLGEVWLWDGCGAGVATEDEGVGDGGDTRITLFAAVAKQFWMGFPVVQDGQAAMRCPAKLTYTASPAADLILWIGEHADEDLTAAQEKWIELRQRYPALPAGQILLVADYD